MMDIFAPEIKDSVFFVVKNVSSTGRTIKIFNTTVTVGNTLDVMQIPGVSEVDIRTSLLKGDLRNKLKNGIIQVIRSTIDVSSSDPAFTAFLVSKGIQNLSTVVSANGIQSIISVSNTSTIDQGSSVTSPGALLYVQSFRRWFSMSPDSNATIDGKEILTAGGDGRRWIWVKEMNDPYWATYWAGNTITIDPINGNDENDGITNPLQTILEAGRRLRNARLFSATFTFNFTSTPLTTDRVEWIRTKLIGGHIVVNGGRTSVRTSSLTASTAVQNPVAASGGTATVLGDTSLANWTSDIGSLVRVNAGGNLNNCCWVMKDTGGGGITARASVTRTLTTPNALTGQSTIASGDTYTVETPWLLGLGEHIIQSETGASSFNTIVYNDLDWKDPNASPGTSSFVSMQGTGGIITITFNRCRWLIATPSAYPRSSGLQVLFNHCYIQGASTVGLDAGGMFFTGCAMVGSGAMSPGFYTFRGDTYVQAAVGANALSSVGPGQNSTFGVVGQANNGVACFDGAVGGLLVGRGGNFLAAGLIWGNGNTSGLRLLSGPLPYTSAVPSITGSADFNLVQFGGFRVWIEGSGVYSASTSCSWANLNATVAKAAEDVATHTIIYPSA